MNVLKRMRKITVLLLAVFVVLSIPFVAFATEDTHTVTYVIDGEVVSTQEVADGADAVAPEIPEKVGYTQIAPTWDHDGKNITEDITITAKYTLNEYTITYKFQDGTSRILTYLHGEQIVMLDPPVKEGYYIAWDKTVETLTEDIVINAVYTDPPEDEADDRTPFDNSENEIWTYIILGATAVLIVIFVLLQIQKKKNDKKVSEQA